MIKERKNGKIERNEKIMKKGKRKKENNEIYMKIMP